MGLETARTLAASRAQVIIAGRRREKVEQALASIEGLATGEVVNANSREDTTAFFHRVGPFDHLVLTLGGNEGAGDFRTLDFDMLHRVFDDKFWPLLLAAQTSLDFLRKDGSLTIVTAITAHTPFPGGVALGAVNGALESMVPTLALELQPLRINAVAPGMIATPWWNNLPDQEREKLFSQMAASIPIKRIGRPDDVAQVITMFISNTFLTGIIVDCDGGAHLR
jgi:NAD(P)-dependent dehydrogenase (short-subunit alcohol dehydrogenase family)